MPNLNLFLSADVEVEAGDTSLLMELPKLLRQDHNDALHCILSNVGKYKDQKILFQLRNQANAKPQYNPHGYGHKPLITVIKRLQENGLVTLNKGTSKFSKNELGEYEDSKLSEFIASERLVQICEALGYTASATQHNVENFVELREPKKTSAISYKETPYSIYTNELMSEYCEFLNQHQFEVDGESFGHIHLVRKYSDWDGSGQLKFGGRTWQPFMQFSSDKRSRITIDGQPVTAVDYPASQLNVIYKHLTGNFLAPEDPYEVDGIARNTVKYLVNIMLNSDSYYGASRAANKAANLKDKLKTNANIEQYHKDIKSFGSLKQLMVAIEQRNAPIAECFLKGKAQGQQYAWLEANLVFEVARRLARSGVPALTVHDEFIVPVGVEDEVREFMYTTEVDMHC